MIGYFLNCAASAAKCDPKAPMDWVVSNLSIVRTFADSTPDQNESVLPQTDASLYERAAKLGDDVSSVPRDELSTKSLILTADRAAVAPVAI